MIRCLPPEQISRAGLGESKVPTSFCTTNKSLQSPANPLRNDSFLLLVVPISYSPEVSTTLRINYLISGR